MFLERNSEIWEMRILVQGYLNIKTILGNYIYKFLKIIVVRNNTFYNRIIFSQKIYKKQEQGRKSNVGTKK